MKNMIILLAIFYCVFSRPAHAQNNFKETYKKAYGFTTTNQDSALVWAEKSVKYAQTPQQKYRASYLVAFSANKMCLYGMARKGYSLAVKFATDSMAKYDAMNSLSNTYVSAGEYAIAEAFNQKSIAYFTQHQHWVSLSYAYELRAWILQKQNNKGALQLLRKVIKLRQKHAPDQIGFAYAEMAKAFANFNMYDSAVIYRRKAVTDYPLKSPDKMAQQKILLAKYLVFANQANEALTNLKAVRPVQKLPFTKLLWCHTFGLYLQQQKQYSYAKRTFAHCDSLLQTLLEEAPDVVTRKTISEQALDLYRDVLKLKNLQVVERARYEGKLQTMQARLEGYHKELTLMDTIHTQNLAHQLTASSNQSTSLPTYLWWGLLLGILGLLAYWIRRKTHQKSPPELETLVKERQLIEVLETKAGGPLEKATREMVLLCYQGKSFTQIAQELGVTRDSVKGRFRRLAKKADIVSVSKFVETFQFEESEK